MKSTMNTTMNTMKLGLGTLTCALLLLAVTVAPAWAAPGDPPPGWIFQLAPPGPQGSVLSGYQQFTTSFIATSNYTYVSFAFREDPAFFAFDNASVKLDPLYGGTGTELLHDPGFESAALGSNTPAGWNQWFQPPLPPYAGFVAGSTGSNCDPNGAFAGTQFWCDGSVRKYDGLYQKIATTPGDKYDISFYLGDNSRVVPYNPGIDMFVYAGDSLPGGTQSYAPEPSSLLLLGSGILGIGGLLRKRFLG
jgi:PEP-CTERM motif